MFIIEGSDALGKTTLAKKICKEYGVQYRHMSKPASDFDHLAGYLTQVGYHVQDRYHLGSLVYGQMLQLGSYPTPTRMRIVQRYLQWRGCITLVLYANRSWLEEQLKLNPKAEMYDAAQVLAANDGFRALSLADNRGVGYADFSFDVTDGWPELAHLSMWLEAWQALWNK